jgi:hypothetical protein
VFVYGPDNLGSIVTFETIFFRPLPEIEVERLNVKQQSPFQGSIPRQPFIVNFKVFPQNGINNKIIPEPLSDDSNFRPGSIILS